MAPTRAASARRTAPVGEPRSAASPDGRSTAAKRSPRPPATRSIRNVAGPSARARRRRWRNTERSKTCGGDIRQVYLNLAAAGERFQAQSCRAGADRLPTPLGRLIDVDERELENLRGRLVGDNDLPGRPIRRGDVVGTRGHHDTAESARP